MADEIVIPVFDFSELSARIPQVVVVTGRFDEAAARRLLAKLPWRLPVFKCGALAWKVDETPNPVVESDDHIYLVDAKEHDMVEQLLESEASFVVILEPRTWKLRYDVWKSATLTVVFRVDDWDDVKITNSTLREHPRRRHILEQLTNNRNAVVMQAGVSKFFYWSG